MISLLLKTTKILVKLAIILTLVPVALFFIAINIPQYNYGINKSDTSLPYPSYYDFYGDSHDFSTILHTKTGEFKHQSDALIYIEHMYVPVVGKHKKDNVRISRITINNIKNITVNKVSIKHLTHNKEIISYVSDNHQEFQKCMKKPKGRCNYQQIYKNKALPNKMTEQINIEYSVNSQNYSLSKTYHIEWAHHYYPVWSAIMSV